MAYDPINLGAAPNDGTGNSLRAGGLKIDANFAELFGLLPVGEAVAAEALAPGDLVHLYTDTGAIVMQKADADDVTKPANGFVKAAVAMGDPGTFYGPGLINDQVAGLIPGKTYYLSTVAGGLTDDVSAYAYPKGTQVVGIATEAGKLLFYPGAMIEAP